MYSGVIVFGEVNVMRDVEIFVLLKERRGRSHRIRLKLEKVDHK